MFKFINVLLFNSLNSCFLRYFLINVIVTLPLSYFKFTVTFIIILLQGKTPFKALLSKSRFLFFYTWLNGDSM